MSRKYRKSRDREIDQEIAERMQALILRPPTSALVLRQLMRPNALDPRLVTTDRHMQRWAVGQGTGLSDISRALYVQSRLTPLPSEVAIKTDQIVLDSPAEWRRFVSLWYRSDCSVDDLVKEFRMSRDRLFIERRIVLSYLLGRLAGAGIALTIFG